MSEVEQFDYYMVRLSRLPADPQRLSGQIERLGSGERQSFDSGEEFLHLVAQWSASELGTEAPDTNTQSIGG